MRLLLGPAAVILAAMPGGSSPAPLYGVAWDRSPAVVRVDPDTLRPLAGRRAPIAGEPLAWSFAPDGRRMVLGSAARGARLRLIDLRTMRVLGQVELARRGSEAFTTWAGRSRVLAAVVTRGCCGAGDTVVASVDVRRRRVVSRRALGGSLQGGEPFRGGMVLVLGPRDRTVGPSRLAVIEPDGRVRSAPLPEIPSGGGWNPGLAVDPSRGRAFVVQAGAPVAEVDLASLRVWSHVVESKATAADALVGPTRDAHWIGRGVLGVTGYDCPGTTPAGLTLIDTRTWQARTIDQRATDVSLVAGTLLATSWPFECGAAARAGGGLTGYAVNGRRRFHRYGDAPIIGVQAVGANALVGTRTGLALIDGRTGRGLRSFRRLRVSLLAAQVGFPY
jgi:hypothetical protein